MTRDSYVSDVINSNSTSYQNGYAFWYCRFALEISAQARSSIAPQKMHSATTQVELKLVKLI